MVHYSTGFILRYLRLLKLIFQNWKSSQFTRNKKPLRKLLAFGPDRDLRPVVGLNSVLHNWSTVWHE